MTTQLNMSDTDYHAHAYIGSTTAKLALESTQLFKDAIDGIIPKPDEAHFQMGRIAHMMLLEPDRFAQQITATGPINPGTGKMYGRGTNKFADWQAENPDVIVVEPELPRMLERMPDEVKEIFAQDGVAEESIFVPMGDKWGMKCRNDWRVGTEIKDYKTINDINDCEKHIRKLSYWFSAEWYKCVNFQETGKKHTHQLIFSEKKAPHRWRIYTLDDDYLNYAQDKFEETKMIIHHRFESGDWRDQSPIKHEADLPQYLIEKEYVYVA